MEAAGEGFRQSETLSPPLRKSLERNQIAAGGAGREEGGAAEGEGGERGGRGRTRARRRRWGSGCMGEGIHRRAGWRGLGRERWTWR